MAAREFELLFKLQASLGSKFRDSFSQAKKATQELQEHISKTNSTAADITGYKKTQLSLDTNIAKQRQYSQELANLEAEQKKAGGSSAELATKIARKKEQLEKANESVRKTSQSLSEYEKRLKEAGIDTNNLSKESARLATEVTKAQQAQEKAAKLGELQASNRAAISKTKRELAGVVGVATAVGTALYVGPIKSAMTFESSMADVAKVVDGLRDSSGALTPEYTAMKKEILDLTKTIPMTANELTEIAAAAGQAGIARNEITKFTSDAAKMGIAFDVTAEQAGDYMAKWRTSFGLTQDQVIELADKINYLGDTSAAQANQIAGVVTSVGPLGEVAGFASGEIAALGATLIGVGVQEEVAATGIKKLMTTMTAGESATKKQKEVLSRLGFSASEMANRMQTDAKGAVLDLMAAIKKLPEAEQAAALKNYFGQESIGALAPLLTNLDLLEEQFQKVGDKAKYAGSMEEEFANRSKTTENSLILAKNALKALSINIGSVFLPYVAQAAQKAAEFTNKIAEFAGKHPTVVKAIMGIVTGLLAAKGAGLVFKLGFLQAKDSIFGILGAIARLKAANLVGGITKVKGVLLGMSGGVLPVIAAITAVAVAIKLIMGNVDAIREKIRGVFGEGGVAIFDKFVGIINQISNAIKNIFGGGTDGISGFFNSFAEGSPIMEKVGSIIQSLIGTVSAIITVIANAVQSILPTLISVITTIASTIGSVLQTVLPVLLDIIGQILPVIQSAAEMILPLLAQAINSIASAIMPIVSFLIPIFMELLNALMPVIQILATIFTTYLGAAVQQVAALVGGLVGIFSGLIQFITGVFTGNWGAAWEGVKNIFSSAFNALIGLVKAPINAVISLVNRAIGALNKIKIPDWVPGVGGKGINIPKIPQLWKGSTHTPDTFIAGEQGPELVMGKGGSKVFTAHTTKGIFTGLKDSFLSAKEMLSSFPRPSLTSAPSLALAGASGGRSVVINSQPHFHLMNGDPKEIGKALEENNERLKREIKEEMENEEEDRRRRGY